MVPGNANTENNLEQSTDLSQTPAEFLVVRQPPKIESLLTVLMDLEKISETISEDRSQDMGAGGQGAAQAGQGDDDDGQVSPRQKAIQSLPSTEAMRRRLTRHLEREVGQLERKAKREARRIQKKKGSAYFLNEAYARIRKIRSLIAELTQAAADLVRRLYIRLFIDHQQLV